MGTKVAGDRGEPNDKPRQSGKDRADGTARECDEKGFAGSCPGIDGELILAGEPVGYSGGRRVQSFGGLVERDPESLAAHGVCVLVDDRGVHVVQLP